MLPFLQEFKKNPYDCVYFLPDPKGGIHVESATYKDQGEKLGGSSLGDLYHICLFKETKEYKLTNVDKFEAILGCPLEYMSGLLPGGWYGILARKTTTSQEFFDEITGKIIA